MYASIALVAALAASAFAAPANPNLDGASQADIDALSAYFNALAREVPTARAVKVPSTQCDLSSVSLPSSTLPPPAAGLRIHHIALGRGTQNYTCAGLAATAAPAQVGANATLYNVTCEASIYPSVLPTAPKAALAYNNQGSGTGIVAPPIAAADVTGHHFFTPNATTPFFNLNTAAYSLGEIPAAKNASATAPSTQGGQPTTGQNGEPAVAWLQLLARPGATNCLQQVYRVYTAGGSAPATCSGQADSIFVQYAAIYFFYSSC